MEEMKIFNSFDKSMVNLQRGFIAVMLLALVGLGYGYYYMNEQISLAKNQVIVLDTDNSTYIGHKEQITRERREGQIKRHVEMFMEYFWNVSQDKDNLEKSVNKALNLADDSGVRLYERYYVTQGLANWLFENSAQSFISVEEVFIDMSSYPYEGYVIAINELETANGSSKRHMDLSFKVKNYRPSYENVAGALLTDIEVRRDKVLDGNE